jgi:hypothetical protein
MVDTRELIFRGVNLTGVSVRRTHIDAGSVA